MKKTTYKGEHILHRQLWQIVAEEAERATVLDREWFNPSLVAMVFAFHTVEAYLNYLGERLAPEIWKDERDYFRKEPYRGFEGKLRKITELVGQSWTPPDRPLATILELKQLRDFIAHGKPEKLRGVISHPDGTDAPYFAPTLWQKMVILSDKSKSVLSDVELFLCQLHDCAKPKLKVNDVWFGDHPLRGPLDYTGYSTTSENDRQ